MAAICRAPSVCVTPGPPHIRQSLQPPCPVIDRHTESGDMLSSLGSWVWDLILNPEVSDGFLGQGVWQREAFSRVRARWVVHTGSEWL